MNRDYMLGTCSSLDDNECFGLDYFRINITAELAQRILRRIEMLKAVKNVDPSCFELVFWDTHGDYYSGDPEGGHDPGKHAKSTECEEMVVQDDVAYWKCRPKDCNVFIMTHDLSVEQLMVLSKED